MSEREIRNIIRSVCADLDERARRAANARIKQVVLPAALGATLAVSGCASETNSRVPVFDASSPDSTQVQPNEGGPGAEAGEPDAGPVPEYDAPLPDSGGMPEYMAVMPDASSDGATGEDAQTATDASQTKDAGRLDVGPVLEYAAPVPDSAILPPYMAIIPDAEVQALYMAVIVDAGDPDPDPTPVPLYDAPMPKK